MRYGVHTARVEWMTAAKALYTEHAAVTEPVELCAVPYYAWANREPGEMQVWIRRSV